MEIRSLSRDEVLRTFALPADALEALIRSGRLLCHVVDGEPRIPLAQLEAFFREGLMHVYRAEAVLQTVTVASPAAATRGEEPRREREPEPELAAPSPSRHVATAPAAAPPPPDPQPQPEEHAEAEADRDDDRDRDSDADADAADDRDDRPDYRAQPRFVPRRQIDGIFGDSRFTIVQLSSTGLRIRHDDALVPGGEAKMSFALMTPTARSFVMRARVVWTSLARYGESDRTFYISGLRVTEHADRLMKAIEILAAAHDLQPDRRASPRMQPAGDDDLAALSGVSDDEVALVMKAIQRFAADPAEATRWYGRGRFALADPQVRRDAPPKPRDREEVLAIWEFLDRQIAVPKINDVLAWTRRTSRRVG